MRHLQQVCGYSERAANVEADSIGVHLAGHGTLYDLLQNELGSRFVLDEWARREETQVRAFLRGHSLHVLPSNAPLSTVVSLSRGLLSKNRVTMKAAGADLVTPISLALSFLDIDHEHPVAKAVSAVYWPAADSTGSPYGPLDSSTRPPPAVTGSRLHRYPKHAASHIPTWLPPCSTHSSVRTSTAERRSSPTGACHLPCRATGTTDRPRVTPRHSE